MIRRVWAAVRSNPVRTWAYGVVVPGFGVLLVYGVLTGEQAAGWLALAGGILAVPGAETVRAKVTPTSKIEPPPVDLFMDAARAELRRPRGGLGEPRH